MIKIIVENSNNYNSVFSEDSKGINWKYRVCESLGDELIRFYNRASINESNLSRLMTHINNACFMISACRGDKTEQENKKSTDELAKDLRNYDLGYVRVLGGYVENSGTDDAVEVTEESFFVPMPKSYSPDDFFNVAIILCKKYNQDSVLISMPNVNAEEYEGFGYYDKNGNLDFSPGEKISFSDEAVKQYFSALVKGSKKGVKWSFTTEWLAVRNPSSQYQAVLMDRNNENLLFKK
jgi:hypothetical protein